MKAKEITAVMEAMCNMQDELNAANVRIDRLVANNAQNDRMLKVNKVEIDTLRDERDAILLKHAELEQLHAAAITGFKSDTELLQAELDAAKMDAKAAKQASMYLGHQLNSLSCVTVDAVAHCNGQDTEALRTFIELVKEYTTLSVQNRVDLDAMVSNLDNDF